MWPQQRVPCQQPGRTSHKQRSSSQSWAQPCGAWPSIAMRSCHWRTDTQHILCSGARCKSSWISKLIFSMSQQRELGAEARASAMMWPLIRPVHLRREIVWSATVTDGTRSVTAQRPRDATVRRASHWDRSSICHDFNSSKAARPTAFARLSMICKSGSLIPSSI